MKIPQYLGKLPNFQYIREKLVDGQGASKVGDFKQYVLQFSSLDTDAKR